jgi:hypothetical protein
MLLWLFSRYLMMINKQVKNFDDIIYRRCEQTKLLISISLPTKPSSILSLRKLPSGRCSHRPHDCALNLAGKCGINFIYSFRGEPAKKCCRFVRIAVVIFCLRESVGLISLIPDGGASKEMLSLR